MCKDLNLASQPGRRMTVETHQNTQPNFDAKTIFVLVAGFFPPFLNYR